MPRQNSIAFEIGTGMVITIEPAFLRVLRKIKHLSIRFLGRQSILPKPDIAIAIPSGERVQAFDVNRSTLDGRSNVVSRCERRLAVAYYWKRNSLSAAQR
jgi:hypothetical protein